MMLPSLKTTCILRVVLYKKRVYIVNDIHVLVYTHVVINIKYIYIVSVTRDTTVCRRHKLTNKSLFTSHWVRRIRPQ